MDELQLEMFFPEVADDINAIKSRFSKLVPVFDEIESRLSMLENQMASIHEALEDQLIFLRQEMKKCS